MPDGLADDYPVVLTSRQDINRVGSSRRVGASIVYVMPETLFVPHLTSSHYFDAVLFGGLVIRAERAPKTFRPVEDSFHEQITVRGHAAYVFDESKYGSKKGRRRQVSWAVDVPGTDEVVVWFVLDTVDQRSRHALVEFIDSLVTVG